MILRSVDGELSRYVTERIGGNDGYRLERFAVSHVPSVNWDAIADDDSGENHEASSFSDSDSEEFVSVGHVEPWMRYLRPLVCLRSLMLAELDDSLEIWKVDIVRVLKASPSLQELGLSVAGTTVTRLRAADPSQRHRTFFQDLCERYAGSGSEPLRLKRLDLGYGVLLLRDNDVDQNRTSNSQNPSSRYTASYLSLLADLSFLEDIHVENRNHSGFDEFLDFSDEVERPDLAWWSFTEDRTPHLRRLTAYQYSKDVHNFLRDLRAEYTEQLAISFTLLVDCCAILSDAANGPPLVNDLLQPDPEHPNLPLRFRMLGMNLSENVHADIIGMGRVPWTVAECIARWSALSGLSVIVEIQDPNKFHQHKEFTILVTALRALGHLRQLHIRLERCYVGPSSKSDSETRQMIYEQAQAFSEAGPALQYIQVGRWAWWIERTMGGAVAALHALHEREAREVELFRLPWAMWPILSLSPDPDLLAIRL